MHVNTTISGAPPAAGTFTAAMKLEPRRNGYVNVSVYTVAAWVATVTLQRYFPDLDKWLDVQTYTSDEENGVSDFEQEVSYRIGVKNGDWTSGTVGVRLGG